MKLMAMAAAAMVLMGCAGSSEPGECTPYVQATYAVTLETPAGCDALPEGQLVTFHLGVVDAPGASTRSSADSCSSVVTTSAGDALDVAWADDWSSANGTYRVEGCKALYGARLVLR